MRIEAIKEFVANKLSKGLDKRLTYHDLQHTFAVHAAVKFYAQAEGIDKQEVKLLEVAALFHDSGFLQQREGHEERSCEIARKDLPQFACSAEEIEKICSFILATKVGYLPLGKSEMIMKDADLDYLGTENYFEISNRLFVELKNFELIKSSENEWFNMQIAFLKKHRYHTNSAIQLREEGKQKVLNLLAQKKHV